MVLISKFPFIIKYTDGIKNTVVIMIGIEPLAIIFTMLGFVVPITVQIRVLQLKITFLLNDLKEAIPSITPVSVPV
ncbi:arylsulfatase [Edwardsiella piscicida]|nr:hypothetical protein QY76_13835 [Edwardsiella sp. EA181011]GAJ66570.1 arylsulfatase [Edwardsiella piscicida]